MLNETFIRKLNKIISEYSFASQPPDDLVEQIVYLTNDLKNDIAQAIKEKGQSSGGVDFISVPEAIKIVADGGIPTKRELIELAQEYMNDGNVAKANELLNQVLSEKNP